MDTDVPGTCQRRAQDRPRASDKEDPGGLGTDWGGRWEAGGLRQRTREQVEGSQGRSGWPCPCPRGAPALEPRQAMKQ